MQYLNQLLKKLLNKKLLKAQDNKFYNTIKNTPGVKETELKWIGLEGFLKDKNKVSQKEVLDFIEANKIDVNERSYVLDMQQGQVKPLKDFTREDCKIKNKIFEDIEAMCS